MKVLATFLLIFNFLTSSLNGGIVVETYRGDKKVSTAILATTPMSYEDGMAAFSNDGGIVVETYRGDKKVSTAILATTPMSYEDGMAAFSK